jgi:hypothetical protein
MTNTTITTGIIKGRDGWILLDALATALVALERLPENRRPNSNMEDMRRMLALNEPVTVSLLLAQAKCRLFPELDPLVVYREYGLHERGSDRGRAGCK